MSKKAKKTRRLDPDLPSPEIVAAMLADAKAGRIDALIESIVLKTLSIYRHPRGSAPNRIEHLGSGFLLHHLGRYFAVSAAHVVANTHQFDLVVLRNKPGPARNRNIVLPTVWYATKSASADHSDDPIDVGIIPLESVHVEFFGRENFFTIEDCDLSHRPSSTALYTAFGFPNTRNEPDHFKRKVEPRGWSYSQPGATPEWYKKAEVRVETHFVLKLDRKFLYRMDGATSAPPDRHGMSGGPFFFCREYASENSTWWPLIVGVNIENPLSGRLSLFVASRIGFAFQLIEEYSRLAPAQMPLVPSE